MPKTSLQSQSIANIIDNCRQEALRLISEVGHCFELFRRALGEGNEPAWEALVAQYRGLVISWVRKFSLQSLSAADEDDLLQESFNNFWLTLHKMGATIAENFPHVGALLKYLSQCARTAVLAHQRKVISHLRLEERLKQEAELQSNLGVDEMANEEHEEQRPAVEQWLEHRLSDPQEKMLIYLSFDLGLTPSQIVNLHETDFPDKKTVYRVKERVLKRMKRDLVDANV